MLFTVILWVYYLVSENNTCVLCKFIQRGMTGALPSWWLPNGKPWRPYYNNTGVGLDLDTLIWLEVDSSIQRCLASNIIRAATPISSMEGSASGLIPSPANGPVHQRHSIWRVTPLSLIGLPGGSDINSEFPSPDLAPLVLSEQ